MCINKTWFFFTAQLHLFSLVLHSPVLSWPVGVQDGTQPATPGHSPAQGLGLKNELFGYISV
uniref:Uncharacterized protein n=1 Tax=Anguilla anguilla TaxID=7936 RepID=A0A0E9XYT3_ANGAN